jgi:hypothetical protein
MNPIAIEVVKMLAAFGAGIFVGLLIKSVIMNDVRKKLRGGRFNGR